MTFYSQITYLFILNNEDFIKGCLRKYKIIQIKWLTQRNIFINITIPSLINHLLPKSHATDYLSYHFSIKCYIWKYHRTLHSVSGLETSNHNSLKQSNPFLSTLRDASSVMLIQDQWNLSRVFHIFRLLQKLSLKKLVEVIYQDTWMCVSRRTGEFRRVLLTLIHNQFFPSDDVEISNTFFLNCVSY